MRPSRLAAVPRTVALLLLAALFLAPFYLLARNALLSNAEITAFDWKWWPTTAAPGKLQRAFRARSGQSDGAAADGGGTTQLVWHGGHHADFADAVFFDGRLRPGAHSGARAQLRFLPNFGDANDSRRGDLRALLRGHGVAGRRQHALGHRGAGTVFGVLDFPVSPVLSALSPPKSKRPDAWTA